jgi:[acyl-carrier-protein] S-malonyltransferase
MQPAADKFEKLLESVEFKDTQCPVITNVVAEPETNGSTLKSLLIKQLLSPVRWVDSMNWLVSNGATATVEVGPGAVLKGLARKCDRNINVVSCNGVDNLYSCVD